MFFTTDNFLELSLHLCKHFLENYGTSNWFSVFEGYIDDAAAFTYFFTFFLNPEIIPFFC